MKKFIQYGYRLVDEKCIFNKYCYGYIQWFDGGKIVEHQSENFTLIEDCYKWIENELEKILSDDDCIQGKQELVDLIDDKLKSYEK